jgi:hypothetical protein
MPAISWFVSYRAGSPLATSLYLPETKEFAGACFLACSRQRQRKATSVAAQGRAVAHTYKAPAHLE